MLADDSPALDERAGDRRADHHRADEPVATRQRARGDKLADIRGKARVARMRELVAQAAPAHAGGGARKYQSPDRQTTAVASLDEDRVHARRSRSTPSASTWTSSLAACPPTS